MQSRSIANINIYFDPSDAPTAEVITDSVARSLALIDEGWGLVIPPDCRIYVMTSWRKFYKQSAPWVWCIYLFLTYPLWGLRAQRMWSIAGAWTQNYGRRVAIGVKPPRMLEVSDKSIGQLIFVEEPDPDKKLQQLTCHELTHACAARLRLPAWLNEGLAMLTVDRLTGKRSVRGDSFELVEKLGLTVRPPGYRQLARMKPEQIAGYTALGYWLVSYLEETQPGFIKSLLAAVPRYFRWEDRIIASSGLKADEFWGGLANTLSSYFLGKD